MMMTQTVVGLYDDYAMAQQAAIALENSGFTAEDVSLIAAEPTRRAAESTEMLAVSSGRGRLGATVGGIAGLLVGLGAVVRMGPIVAAGPVVGLLAGAGIGAAAARLVTALTHLGIPADRAGSFAERIRRGGTLVIVRARNPLAPMASDALIRAGAIDVERQSDVWGAAPIPRPRAVSGDGGPYQDHLFPVEGQLVTETEAWYTLRGVRRGPFGSSDEAELDLLAWLDDWRRAARRLGGWAWRRTPVEIVVTLPDGVEFTGPDALTSTEARSELVSERRMAEQALRASEARYRRLFDSAGDGILVIDATSGRVLEMNPYLTELLGVPAADVVGREIWVLPAFHDIIDSRDGFGVLLTMAEMTHEDLRVETTDGRRLDVNFASKVYQVDGKTFVQCNIRDVSNRRNAERTRIALQDQLRASQKMEAIGGLAGGVAHDFNNLLSVILCYTGFALEGVPEGNAVRADLLEVEKAGRRAAALTRQLLDFSRKQVLNLLPLDVNRITEGIDQMFRRILGEHIELVLVLAPDLGLTVADPSQIEQVVMNLVVNARDAMPEGGRLTITTGNVELDADFVSAHADATAGSYIVLAVMDNGCGMDREVQSRIFEPFFTTKALGQGTGLGLSTVCGIVKQSGGSISVTSEVGLGTTIEVYLPRVHAPRVDASPETAPKPSRRPGGAELVLIVEDEDAVRSVAERILTTAGHSVLTAANGRDALLLCESHVEDLALVLTDIVMPELNGGRFADELRKLRPATKVLFMSGYPDDPVHRGALDAGTGFIGKPFNAMDLVRKVRELLDHD